MKLTAWNMKRYLCYREVGMLLLDVRRIDFWKKTFQILMVLMNPCYLKDRREAVKKIA